MSETFPSSSKPVGKVGSFLNRQQSAQGPASRGQASWAMSLTLLQTAELFVERQDQTANCLTSPRAKTLDPTTILQSRWVTGEDGENRQNTEQLYLDSHHAGRHLKIHLGRKNKSVICHAGTVGREGLGVLEHREPPLEWRTPQRYDFMGETFPRWSCR